MNCPNCGASNLDTSSLCVVCGRPLNAAPQQQQPTYTPPAATYTPPPPPPHSNFGAAAPLPGTPIPNYLVQSIIATLCCCLPLGVVAIIFSAQVNSKLAAGDIAGAQEASNKAKLFCWISFGLGIAGIIVSLLINGAALLSNLGR